jgi:uncharacterized protein YwqG
MDSGIPCSPQIYTEDQIPNLILLPAPPDSRIESRVISNWLPFNCFDCTSERSYATVNNSGIDSLTTEEFARTWRKSIGGTYLLGCPWFEQGEYSLGDGYSLLASFAQDSACSMMWGDAGVAHLWIKGKGLRDSQIFWACG